MIVIKIATVNDIIYKTSNITDRCKTLKNILSAYLQPVTTVSITIVVIYSYNVKKYQNDSKH